MSGQHAGAEAEVRSRRPRARYPDAEGFVQRDGVRVFWERYGDGEPAVLLLPTWSLAHSRVWKAQIPYLARRFRVLTFDPRGNGRSDRPAEPAAYAEQEFADDALAVLDTTGTEQAVLVSLSRGAERCLLLAAEHPERVAGAVFIGAGVPLPPPSAVALGAQRFDERLERHEGWQRFNRHYWLDHYEEFVEFFVSQVFSEPHSSKQREDALAWGLETDPRTLIATRLAPTLDEQCLRGLASRISCPVLVVHGSDDRLRSPAVGEALAELLGGSFVEFEGSGHAPHARDPVRFNLLLRDFVDAAGARPRRWRRAHARRKRALYLSSPIGLGHVRRDLAIADELRKLHPELQIDWLAQHPVTTALETAGEHVHPASTELASECRHLEAEAGEHDLHAFQAYRRMDEILLANFMLFHDVADQGQYDLWIGDEAWELDYFLHENPELKSAAYVWLTDFVGWLPMPDGDDHGPHLAADYNAEMLEQVERYPRLRDRALFVGDPDDIVAETFGAELPAIRDWAERHYAFTGYITGFDPTRLPNRDQLRADLGYRPDEAVCVVSVGGSGVGAHLLRRAIAAFPQAKRLVPGLRMLVVAGPRIDPRSLPQQEGLDLHGYVRDLHHHLAACDLAITQGGLTTTMELVATRRPFLYFPLRHHFEQNLHVPHRLERYHAGRRMNFDTDGPDAIALAIAEEIRRPADYRPVDGGGAARAAAAIAELI